MFVYIYIYIHFAIVCYMRVTVLLYFYYLVRIFYKDENRCVKFQDGTLLEVALHWMEGKVGQWPATEVADHEKLYNQ